MQDGRLRFESIVILNITMKLLLARILLSNVFLFSISASADNWPAWRGPQGMGVSKEKQLPLRWSRTENVQWRTPLPERGNSTPVVWDDSIFVTQAIEKEGRRTLMCFNRADGHLRWQSGVAYPEKEVTHATNPYCSASPVTDGERVIASFGSAGLFCYDFNGKEIWRRDLGKQAHIWGNAASPVIYGDLCILNFGPGERTFLIALDKRTGKTIWQHDEPDGKFGESSSDWNGSWSTPIIETIGGQTQIIMSYPKRVCALDPKTGREFWSCRGLTALVYTSPLYDNGVVVAMSGFSGSALAVKMEGLMIGDITEDRLWLHPKAKQRIGSGVIHDGHIFISSDAGVAECFELKTGKLVWEERLAGPGPTASSWSSMVLADGKVYSVNQSGDAFVLKASPKFELLSTNSIGEKTLASLAVSDGQIFVRTYQNLWCVGDRKRSR